MGWKHQADSGLLPRPPGGSEKVEPSIPDSKAPICCSLKNPTIYFLDRSRGPGTSANVNAFLYLPAVIGHFPELRAFRGSSGNRWSRMPWKPPCSVADCTSLQKCTYMYMYMRISIFIYLYLYTCFYMHILYQIQCHIESAFKSITFSDSQNLVSRCIMLLGKGHNYLGSHITSKVAASCQPMLGFQTR